jgi:UDP-glucose 4-epimerase
LVGYGAKALTRQADPGRTEDVFMPNQDWDLVTGAAGFIGSHLVDHLVGQGRQVIALDSLDTGISDNLSGTQAHFIRGDVRDRHWWPALEDRRIGRIFHLAANASVPRSVQDPEFNLSTNISGTMQMLELARAHGALIVSISSAAVYGTPQALPMSESHPILPISHYGVSKLAGEHYVEFYRREYGLQTRIIRYFNVFGPRQARYIMFDYLRRAHTPGDVFDVLGDGTQVRTQLYVSDAVAGTLAVAEHGDFAPYNIGAEQEFTVLELAHKVLHLTNQAHRRVVTTGQSWPGDIPVLKPDISRARQIGFKPVVGVDEGLARLLEWWRVNKLD